ncbi:MAG: hypothetical protein IJ814_08445 [Paludibacteraceae bacterium]|nr:hypothetical protein [Paludibacteraceae bacterium]
MKKRLYIFAFCTLYILPLYILSSCTRYTPAPYRGLPKEYSVAYQELYGRCYDSIPYSVVALDLYSDSLSLDKNRRMQGTGYNLYISDIFVSADTLTPGEYHSIHPDSLSSFTFHLSPSSFLPGRDWDGTPTGMYLLYVEQGKLQSIQLLDSGSFILRDTTNGLADLQFTLYYKNAYGYRATYTPHFQGVLTCIRK